MTTMTTRTAFFCFTCGFEAPNVNDRCPTHPRSQMVQQDFRPQVTKFDNHAPINFESAETLASSEHDGGSYSGIGYNDWYIKKGKQLHFYHEASSGCEYNNRTDHSRTYLFGCRTTEEMIQFLLDKLPGDEDEGLTPRIINDLLTELGYAEES